MNEKDREAADDWIRDNMPDPAECSFEDTEEAGSTESYFFLRYRDSATVVYRIAVKGGKVSSVVNRSPDNAIRRPFPLHSRRKRPDPPLAEVEVASCADGEVEQAQNLAHPRPRGAKLRVRREHPGLRL